MTDPSRTTRDPLGPEVEVSPQVRAAAGAPTSFRVVVHNRGAGVRQIAVAVVGVDAGWLPVLQHSAPLPPGSSCELVLAVTPPPGTLAARYPVTVVAQALDPLTCVPTAADALAATTIVVDAAQDVDVDLVPRETSVRRSRRLQVVLHNHGTRPARARLAAETPTGIRVRFDDDVADIAPGGRTVVTARLQADRVRLTGGDTSTFAVLVHTSAAPRRVTGSVRRRSVFGAGGVKIAALVAIVGIWAGAAFVGLPRAAELLTRSGTPPAGSSGAVTPPAAGAGSSVAGGSGSGTSAGGGGAGTSAADARTVRLNGVVQGDAQAGVTVNVSPTSLADSGALDATPVGMSASAFTAHAMVPAAALTRTPGVATSRTATTADDGTWSFPDLRAPGLYEVVFSKPGYQVQRYIVDSATVQADQPLKVALRTGSGTITGHVVDPGGAGVAGATVTVGNGLTTLTTRSATGGDTGSFAVTGLSTPAPYVVTATRDGLGSESTLVTLDPSGSGDTRLTLRPGVAAITGVVSGGGKGLPNATVTVTDGEITRNGSTVTASGAEGSYSVPGLPTPGSYTVTVASPGYSTVVEQVTLTAGRPAPTVSPVMHRSTGSVSGTVAVDGDPATPAVGAGVTLVGSAGSFKTLVDTPESGATAAGFDFPAVPPGHYVVTATLFGAFPASVPVDVTADAEAPVDGDNRTPRRDPITLTKRFVGSVQGTSKIALTVISSDPLGRPIGCRAHPSCVTVQDSYEAVDQQARPTTSAAATADTCFEDKNPNPDRDPDPVLDSSDGPVVGCVTSSGYGVLPSARGTTGFEAGLHTLTVSAPGFVTARTQVQVAEDATARPPAVRLRPLGYVSGTVTGISPVNEHTTVDDDGPLTCVVASTGTLPPIGSTCSAGHRSDGAVINANTCTVGTPAAYTQYCALAGVAPHPPADALVPASCPVGAPSGWCLPFLPAGTYHLGVYTGGSSEFLPSTTPVTVDVGAGDERSGTDVRLDRLPRVTITTLQSAAGDTPVPTPAGRAFAQIVDAATGQITGSALEGNRGNTFTFGRLPDRDLLTAQVCVDVADTAGDGPSGDYAHCVQDAVAHPDDHLTRSSDLGPLAVDTTTPVTAVATRSRTFTGRVVWDLDGDVTPVPQATVQVTGVVRYDDAGAPVSATSAGVAVGACGFAVVRPGTTPAPVDGCTPAAVELGLVSPVVTLRASSTATSEGRPEFATTVLRDQLVGEDVQIDLDPTPAILDAQVVFAPAGTLPAGIHVVVSSQTTSTGRIAAAVTGPDGRISWRDGSLPGAGNPPANRVVPGTYRVTVTAPGWTDTSGDLDCTTPAATCGDDLHLTLRQLTTVVVTVTSSATPPVPLPSATVSLRTAGGSPLGPTRRADGDGQATFTDLPAGASGYTGGYAVLVDAPGFRDDPPAVLLAGGSTSVADGRCTPTSVAVGGGLDPGATLRCTVQLVSSGRITGTIRESVGPDASRFARTLPGAEVTGTPCTTAEVISCDADPSFTTRTDSDGRYTLPDPDDPNGLYGRYWLVSVLGTAGHDAGDATGVVDLGTDFGVARQDVTVRAQPVATTIRLSADGNRTFVTDASIRLIDDHGAEPVVPPLRGSAFVFPADTGSPSALYERSYTVMVSGAGYSAYTTTITPHPGDASFDLPVTPVPTSVQIDVLAPTATTATPVPVPDGVLVRIGTPSANGFTVAQSSRGDPLRATTSGGTVSFASVPDGTYTIRVEVAGYRLQDQPLTVAAPTLIPPQRVVLTRLTATLALDIQVPDGSGSPVVSATVTPRGAGNTTQTVPAAVTGLATQRATFTAVGAGTYDVTFSLATGHTGAVTQEGGTTAVTVDAPEDNRYDFVLHERELMLDATITDDAGDHTAVGSLSVSDGQDIAVPDGATSAWIPTTAVTALFSAPAGDNGAPPWQGTFERRTIDAGSGAVTLALEATQLVRIQLDVTVQGRAPVATDRVTVDVYVDGGPATRVPPTGLAGRYLLDVPQSRGVVIRIAATRGETRTEPRAYRGSHTEGPPSSPFHLSVDIP